MTTQPHFIVAKYAPDIDRMEPRNIGIVMWSEGQTAVRFADPEELDFINEQATYHRWVNHWTRLANSESIRIHAQRSVRRSNPRFLEHFLRAQKGNYFLEAGGMFVDAIARLQMKDAVDFLFDRLIGRASNRIVGSVNLEAKCDAVLQQAGVTKLSGFRRDSEIDVSLKGVDVQIDVHYVIRNESETRAAMLRVRLQQLNATSAAFKFNALEQSRHLPKDRLFALYEASEKPAGSEAKLLSLIETTATPVNVSDPNFAVQQIRRLVA